jgi:hypothetical protein
MKTLLIACLTTLMLAACTDMQDSAPSHSSYAEPAPGTVTVHMNGSLNAAIGATYR